MFPANQNIPEGAEDEFFEYMNAQLSEEVENYTLPISTRLRTDVQLLADYEGRTLANMMRWILLRYICLLYTSPSPRDS